MGDVPAFDADDYDGEMPDLGNEPGLVNKAALQKIIANAVDALRPVGLTLNPQDIQYAMTPDGTMFMMLPCMVRASATERAEEDIQSREAFNKQMAARHRDLVEKRKEDIQKLMQDEDALAAWLEGDESVLDTDECSHERLHPSTGHCLDCGKGLES